MSMNCESKLTGASPSSQLGLLLGYLAEMANAAVHSRCSGRWRARSGILQFAKGNPPAMGSFSLFHWLVLLVVIMLLFGPSRLPSIGKNLGEAIRGLKNGLAGNDD